jgi:DtxR family Mn-dependent transcriptional regulator
MTSETGLSESMENYLEVILDLEQANKVARAKDIADRLGVKRGSVTGALKNLGEKGFINYAPYSFITLTNKGKKVAKDVAHRHAVLKNFLLNILQIDPETAEKTACGMEHAIDTQTLERLVCFIDYIHKCPRTGEDWIKAFVNYYTSNDRDEEKCDQCIDTWLTLNQRDKS